MEAGYFSRRRAELQRCAGRPTRSKWSTTPHASDAGTSGFSRPSSGPLGSVSRGDPRISAVHLLLCWRNSHPCPAAVPRRNASTIPDAPAPASWTARRPISNVSRRRRPTAQYRRPHAHHGGAIIAPHAIKTRRQPRHRRGLRVHLRPPPRTDGSRDWGSTPRGCCPGQPPARHQRSATRP